MIMQVDDIHLEHVYHIHYTIAEAAVGNSPDVDESTRNQRIADAKRRIQSKRSDLKKLVVKNIGKA